MAENKLSLLCQGLGGVATSEEVSLSLTTTEFQGVSSSGEIPLSGAGGDWEDWKGDGE